MTASVVWAEPNDDASEESATDAAEPAEVDESLESRRLRRWLRAMFGARPPEDDDR